MTYVTVAVSLLHNQYGCLLVVVSIYTCIHTIAFWLLFKPSILYHCLYQNTSTNTVKLTQFFIDNVFDRCTDETQLYMPWKYKHIRQNNIHESNRSKILSFCIYMYIVLFIYFSNRHACETRKENWQDSWYIIVMCINLCYLFIYIFFHTQR